MCGRTAWGPLLQCSPRLTPASSAKPDHVGMADLLLATLCYTQYLVLAEEHPQNSSTWQISPSIDLYCSSASLGM